PNGDYDGNTGAPLPLLWDDEAHDVGDVPVTDPATSTVDLNVVVHGSGDRVSVDCLTTVAHVVASSP
ncbi:MAG TPA: hypothetical protein VHT48_02680, partial [Methylocella sp.]|nr:hypothetical protein [Methylocella sp.]